LKKAYLPTKKFDERGASGFLSEGTVAVVTFGRTIRLSGCEAQRRVSVPNFPIFPTFKWVGGVTWAHHTLLKYPPSLVFRQ
jgi:hypothetical protein